MPLRSWGTLGGTGRNTRNIRRNLRRASCQLCLRSVAYEPRLSFHPPAKEQTILYPHTFDPTFRGTSGPVQVTIPPTVYTVDKLVQETLVNKGLKAIKDPYGGDV